VTIRKATIAQKQLIILLYVSERLEHHETFIVYFVVEGQSHHVWPTLRTSRVICLRKGSMIDKIEERHQQELHVRVIQSYITIVERELATRNYTESPEELLKR